ncbi:hypothetical protein MMC11_003616 [Xylographa trunciseda]|nr:hypothetical protein [Xylographa trunciseda]
MLRVTSAILAALTVLSELNPVLGDDLKVVKYDFVRQQSVATKGAAEASLANELPVGAGIYAINVTIGTPPQSMLLQLDTGSTDIELLATSLCTNPQAVCNPKGLFPVNAGSYNTSMSSTSKFLSGGAVTLYADMTSYSGSLYSDTINVAGVSITNMTLSVIEKASAPPTIPINGIMGIGYAGLEAGVVNNHSNPYPTLIQQMKSQGLINQLAYSIYLNDKSAATGSILFGGIDNEKFTGDLATVPILQNTPPRFLVPWTSLSFSTAGTNISLLNTPVPAVLDSGASVISLTPDIVKSIVAGLGISTENGYTLPCYFGDEQADFTFGFNNDPKATINVPLSALLNPIMVSGAPQTDQNGDAMCKFAVDAAASGFVNLGDSFMRSAYVVFDLENHIVGLAQARLNSTTSNIVAIGGGTGPGTTTIATTIFVSKIFSQSLVIPDTAAAAIPTAPIITFVSASPTFNITVTPTGKGGSATGSAATGMGGSAVGSAATASAIQAAGAVAAKIPGMGKVWAVSGLLGLLSFICGAGIFLVVV